eukprot:TRINITY_DN6271_c0_g1_i1.p1 TRINITY_DN6271_c0_g1~~TRINITY_DN6271_c0_g1_i1.p1  ORF type:complete len:431 (+),score=48.66 TRINITY_DN6271_c0_g1_i1:126-1418(+)
MSRLDARSLSTRAACERMFAGAATGASIFATQSRETERTRRTERRKHRNRDGRFVANSCGFQPRGRLNWRFVFSLVAVSNHVTLCNDAVPGSSAPPKSRSVPCETCQLLATVLHEAVEARLDGSSGGGKYGRATAVTEALDEPKVCKHWQQHQPIADRAGLTVDKMAVECQRQIGDMQDDFEAALRNQNASAHEVRRLVCLKKRGRKKKKALCDEIWNETEAPVPSGRKRREERKVAQENAIRGDAFLKENAHRQGVKTLKKARGLQYKVLRAGNGSVHPGLEDVCLVHYVGILIDCEIRSGPEPCEGGTVFDSTREKEHALSFSAKIAGSFWRKVLPLLVRGDYWEVYVPQALGFAGNDDPERRPAVVGPNATLIFQVELIAVKGKDDDSPGVGSSDAEALAPATSVDASSEQKQEQHVPGKKQERDDL